MFLAAPSSSAWAANESVAAASLASNSPSQIMWYGSNVISFNGSDPNGDSISSRVNDSFAAPSSVFELDGGSGSYSASGAGADVASATSAHADSGGAQRERTTIAVATTLVLLAMVGLGYLYVHCVRRRQQPSQPPGIDRDQQTWNSVEVALRSGSEVAVISGAGVYSIPMESVAVTAL